MSARRFLKNSEISLDNLEEAVKDGLIKSFAVFNGNSGVTINNSKNVVSITRPSAGRYIVTVPANNNAIYCVVTGGTGRLANEPNVWQSAVQGSAASGATMTTTTFEVITGQSSLADMGYITFITMEKRS